MPVAERVTVDDLRRQRRWCDLFEITGAIDSAYAAADFTDQTADVAADCLRFLLLHMTIRELPPNRPAALRTLLLPGCPAGSCLRCGHATCKGNRIELHEGAYKVLLLHHKTSNKLGTSIIIAIPPASVTHQLLTDYIARRRRLLVKTNTLALFVNPRTGDAFGEKAFADYVPNLLQQMGLGKLSYTTVRPPSERARWISKALIRTFQLRHVAAVGVAEWAGADVIRGTPHTALG